MLQFLANVAKGVPQKLEVLSQLVSSLFDLNPNISSYMKVSKQVWGRGVMARLVIGGVCPLRQLSSCMSLGVGAPAGKGVTPVATAGRPAVEQHVSRKPACHLY